jgi:sugar phosphate isomerase/epimerase
MRLGYNTNGLAHHRLTDAIELLADQGYQSVAITLDAGALDPYEEPSFLRRQAELVRSVLDRRGMARVIETGARYLLNPRLKHDPTLMDPDPTRRDVRLDFLCRAIDIAKSIGADTVSLWSGRASDLVDHEQGLDRLVQAMTAVLNHAEETHMTLAFEPEPGMFVDTLERFAELDARIRHPLLQLTIDLGHLHCMGEGDIPTILHRWGARCVNFHIEDMVPGVHDHLMFGEGTMDFVSICRAMRQIGYAKGVHVELSRHSHMAAVTSKAAMAFLNPLFRASADQCGRRGLVGS